MGGLIRLYTDICPCRIRTPYAFTAIYGAQPCHCPGSLPFHTDMSMFPRVDFTTSELLARPDAVGQSPCIQLEYPAKVSPSHYSVFLWVRPRLNYLYHRDSHWEETGLPLLYQRIKCINMNSHSPERRRGVVIAHPVAGSTSIENCYFLKHLTDTGRSQRDKIKKISPHPTDG